MKCPHGIAPKSNCDICLKERRQSPHYKEVKREYNREYNRKYQQSPEYKEYHRNYMKKYSQSPKYKEYQKKYQQLKKMEASLR